MFKKVLYASLTAILVLAGYLNFSTPANAIPPVAVDDIVSIDVGVTSYRTINLTFNDSDAEDVLDLNNIDLDPVASGTQTSFVTLDGTWYVDIPGTYGAEVIFVPNDFYFYGTSTIQYVTVDSDGDVSNIATATIGSYYQAPTAGNLFATMVDGDRVGINWSGSANMPGGFTSDNLDLDPLTPGRQSTSTTPIGVFTQAASSIVFQSTNGLTGVATTTYQIFGRVDGQPSNIAEVTVTVNPNTPPVANNYTYGANIYPDEEINLYVSDLGSDLDQGFFYVSAVDWDLATPGFQNQLTTPEGTWSIANNDPFGFSLYFRAAADFLGTALFPFRLRDNSGISSNVATTTIYIVNDAPIANTDIFLTGTDVPITIDVFQNDNPLGGTLTDVDLYPSTAGIYETSTSTPGGTFTVLVDKKVLFTPAPLFVGTVSVPYVAVDNFGERSIPANIEIEVRDLPVLRVKIGVVDSSNADTNFSPTITGPATITPIPTTTCPAFAGTINSSQLALQNFESDVHILDEGDTVRGVITLENIGSAEAHTIRQLTSSSNVSVSSIVCVMKGDGTVLVNGVDYNEGGINFVEFLDTVEATLSDKTAADGSNIMFIVFDITPNNSFASNYFLNVPLSLLTVTDSMSDVANGTNTFSGSPYKDEVRMFPRRSGSVLQTIIASSSQITTNVSRATIGEILTYRTEIQIPELSTLTSMSTFADTFAPGLVIYDNNGTQNPIRITASTSIIDSNTLGSLFATSQVLSDGNEIEIVFDPFENTDTNKTTVESIIIEYDVIVNDSVSNIQGGVITNNARHIIDASYIDPPGCVSECNVVTGSVTNRAATSSQIIIEPALLLRSVSATTTNASNTAQFIFELFHDGANTNDAQDVVFYLQTNGVGLTPINISNVQVTGLAPATTTIGSLLLSWPTIPTTFTSSSPITISFLGTLNTPATGTTTLLYPVGLTSWSVPGGSLVPLSSFSLLSHARTYTGTSTLGTVFVPSGVLPPPSTSTPTTLGCIGSCGGSFNNPGCTDPKALNYDNWATVNNGSCTYAVATSTTTPTIAPVSTSTLPAVPPIVAPGSTSSPITYIPKAKRQLVLQLTGPLEALQTRLRKDALKVALSEGNAITIPHIGTKKPVLQLPNLDPLLNEFWMLPWGSTPEKGNNTILVAHSYNQQKGKQWPNILFDLDKVKVGEQIVFDWKGKVYTYQVIDNKQFDAKDVYVEDDTKESVLTIYGCGKYTTKYRQVVRALLVDVK